MAEWKKPLLIGIGWGLGTAVGLVVLVGGFLWYQSRPKPPKPWNTSAIVSKDPPGFGSTNDFKQLEFLYSLEHNTNVDYQIESESELNIMARDKDGTLLAPLSADEQHWRLPIFIPAKQRAIVTFLLTVSGIPEHKASETAEQYHERLRAWCEENMGAVASFVVFDRANHYQINLPRWLAEPPKKNP
jgi:hypothetical protein